jgi:hypothetical protein
MGMMTLQCDANLCWSPDQQKCDADVGRLTHIRSRPTHKNTLFITRPPQGSQTHLAERNAD